MFNWFYTLRRNIKNLIKWFPIIWSDRDWDYHYILAILQAKLEFTKQFFLSDNTYCVEANETANEVSEVLEILDRLIKNQYLEEALKPFDEKYPDYDWSLEFEQCDNGYYKLVNKNTSEQKELKSKCYREKERAKEKDFDDLFILLRKNIENWWD